MKDFPGVWIALIGGLFVIHTWVVPAVVNEATSTEWVKGDPDEGGSSLPVSNDHTQHAYVSCNRHLEARESPARFTFPAAPDKAWDIGFGRYVVHASVAIDGIGEVAPQRNYLCHVRFAGGDVADPSQWSVDGLELNHP